MQQHCDNCRCTRQQRRNCRHQAFPAHSVQTLPSAGSDLVRRRRPLSRSLPIICPGTTHPATCGLHTVSKVPATERRRWPFAAPRAVQAEGKRVQKKKGCLPAAVMVAGGWLTDSQAASCERATPDVSRSRCGRPRALPDSAQHTRARICFCMLLYASVCFCMLRSSTVTAAPALAAKYAAVSPAAPPPTMMTVGCAARGRQRSAEALRRLHHARRGTRQSTERLPLQSMERAGVQQGGASPARNCNLGA